MQRIGTRIGNFVLKHLLGSGGMGDVYYAEHESLGDSEARVYKILKPQLMEQPSVVERFKAEARAAAAIKHKNIMRARDFGTVGNSMYIEMDWFEGESLASLLAKVGGTLQPSRIIAILAGVAAGIHAAHKKTIIHRDLKPENIFVATIDGVADVAKVLDFGVAKLRGELAIGTATQTGVMVGTPAYAAPEQFEPNAPITHRVDIWALGAIAYQMATGYLPFQSEATKEAYFSVGPFQIFNRLINQKPIDPCERNPNIPRTMAQVILRALEIEPVHRFESAHAFAIALAESVGSVAQEGLRIVKKYAPEFVDDSNLLETKRSAGARAASARYIFEHKLGEGGMAEVFVGRVTGAEGFSRPVAIKRVLAQFVAHPQFAEMFTKEAQIVSKLEHPNIVTVFDFDRDTSGRPFLVMEYVQGKDLTALNKSGAIPPSIAIYIAIEMLRGLEYAHQSLVLHRDISPHNVLLSWTGTVKVSDFGIAKALDADGTGHSMFVKGKPGYMSPEQIEAAALDGRSDLYAVGIVLWEMVTGQRLFTGGMKESFEAIMHRDTPAPRSVRPVPPDLERVILTFLARSKEQRWPSAAAAIQALAACEARPADGRGDLIRLLADRFPAAAPRATPSTPMVQNASPTALTSRDRPQPAAPAERPSGHLLPTVANPVPIPPSTLGGATGQSMPASQLGRTSRRIWPMLAAICVLGATAGLIASVVSRSQAMNHTSAPGTPLDGAWEATKDARATMVAHAPLDAAATVPDGAPVAPALGADAAVTASADQPDAGTDVTLRPDAAIRSSSPSRNAPAAMGELEITASPWAEIFIDGKAMGQTPKRLTLSAGRHAVLLTQGTKKKTMKITIKKDDRIEIDEDTSTW